MNKLHYLIVIYLLVSYNLLAQQTYLCTVQNQIILDTEISFDIYMQRTGGTEIYLGQSEFSLTFNAGNFTNPTVSFVPESALDWYAVDIAIPIGYSSVVKLSTGALTFSTQTQFDARVFKPSTIAPGTKIATITINNITNPSGLLNLQWKTTTPHESKVYTYGNVSPWALTNITSNGTYTNPEEGGLPVELVSFTGKAADDFKVELKWNTATEINNYGFDIERKTTEVSWEKIGFVSGNGNSNSTKEYSYIDKSPIGGSKFLYRLKQVDNDGQFEYTDVVEVTITPMEYNLYQNYPNPFNPTTKIKFSLPKAGKVSLKIYDITGAEIIELINKDYEAGYYDVELNSSSFALASGVYFYQLRSGDFVKTNKMIIMK